jgi:hypothetical protein
MDVKESKERGVYVKDLSVYNVKGVADCMQCLRVGQKIRKVGATKMNEGSSRSHSIFMITIESSETDAAGVVHYKVGKLNLVDLAGSERQKKTEAVGERLDEAKSINWSLMVLGNCKKTRARCVTVARSSAATFLIRLSAVLLCALPTLLCRHQGSDRPHREARPIPRQQVDSLASRLSRWQHEDDNDRQHRACSVEF